MGYGFRWFSGRFVGLCLVIFLTFPVYAAGAKFPSRYGEMYCSMPGFGCMVIEGHTVQTTYKRKGKTRTRVVTVAPSWEELWPDESEREIVQRLNRTNWKPRAGQVMAYPLDMKGKTYMDFSPLPLSMEPTGEKSVLVDLGILAWGAYDEEGKLVNWGPIAGGRGGGYSTPAGNYRIRSKRGPGYRSSKYPEGCGEKGGCSPMPWAMHFKPDYALHGGSLPGRHASHGCVRMYTEDARWLNKEFTRIGTRVRILPYFERHPGHFRGPEVFSPGPPPVQIFADGTRIGNPNEQQPPQAAKNTEPAPSAEPARQVSNLEPAPSSEPPPPPVTNKGTGFLERVSMTLQRWFKGSRE